MELDYEKLDEILKYLKLTQGYCGWKSYQTYVMNRDNIIMDTINDANSYAGWCNTLLYWGLVDYKYDGNKLHTYIINPKGLDLLNNEKSTRDVHEEFKKRENLENRILEGTIESHRISKTSTVLNKFQLAVTIILGSTTFASFYFQNESNKIAIKNHEIAEKIYQLELKNKESTDTIFIKQNIK